MIEHDGINDQIQLQLHNNPRHSPAWHMSSAYARPITDAQLCYLIGYTMGKFDKAYKCGEDTPCIFNQTNIMCPAYDTTKCSRGYNDGFYSTNSSHFNDYWFGTTPDLVRWFSFCHLLIRRSFYLPA
jgi:hypothetical protein